MAKHAQGEIRQTPQEAGVGGHTNPFVCGRNAPNTPQIKSYI